jgi:hypothetical protein
MILSNLIFNLLLEYSSFCSVIFLAFDFAFFLGLLSLAAVIGALLGLPGTDLPLVVPFFDFFDFA